MLFHGPVLLNCSIHMSRTKVFMLDIECLTKLIMSMQLEIFNSKKNENISKSGIDLVMKNLSLSFNITGLLMSLARYIQSPGSFLPGIKGQL